MTVVLVPLRGACLDITEDLVGGVVGVWAEVFQSWMAYGTAAAAMLAFDQFRGCRLARKRRYDSVLWKCRQ